MDLDDQTRPASNEAQGRIRRENQERILKAAERIFAETGFAGATMAEIAQRAGLPKANVHYYFQTKGDLYQAVMSDILALWLSPVDHFRVEADPAVAFAGYIRAKMEASRTRPYASKVFANEIMHGAERVRRFLSDDLKRLVDEKALVIEAWVAEGRIAPVDSRHIFFMIWAITQHYADFDTQVRTVLGKPRLTRGDFERITGEVVRFVLRGLGLDPARADAAPPPPVS
jgi:TetR/AcrR family transcriptional regulator